MDMQQLEQLEKMNQPEVQVAPTLPDSVEEVSAIEPELAPVQANEPIRSTVSMNTLIAWYIAGVRKGSASIESQTKRLGLKRNSPCSCGSGVKFKKCCRLKLFTSFANLKEVAKINSLMFSPTYLQEMKDIEDTVRGRLEAGQKAMSDFEKEIEAFAESEEGRQALQQVEGIAFPE